jgi:hypothetical protein
MSTKMGRNSPSIADHVFQNANHAQVPAAVAALGYQEHIAEATNVGSNSANTPPFEIHCANFPANSSTPPKAPRTRRKFDAKEKEETNRVRRLGSCEPCRVAKGKVSLHY